MSRGRKTWSWLQIVGLVALVSFSLASGAHPTCEKSVDIELSDHKSFINYAIGKDYAVKKAFDRDNKTLIATYIAWDYNVIPPQYLDKGYNWVMVELNKNKFEMVESVTLVLRQDQTSPSLKRLSDIEVLISSKMDREPTLFVANKAGEISWDYFVGCGTTGSAKGDTTVDCRQHLMNSNFVAVRRNKETGPCKSTDAYCCLDFAELKVNLLFQLDHPKVVETTWEENSVGNISCSTPSKDCVLPSRLRLQWSLSMFNGTMSTFLESSTKLTIQSLKKENSGSYYYKILSSNGSQIFQSNSTEKMFVSYKSHVRNNNTKEYYYENSLAKLLCSTDGGYPHPTQLTTQFMSVSNNTVQMKNDTYYGKEAESSIQIVMKRSMNFQNLTCKLKQPNFTETNKTFTIIVYYKSVFRNNNTENYYSENSLAKLSCSTDGGYPHPTQLTTQFMSFSNNTAHMKNDAYYGKETESSIQLVMNRSMNFQNLTCILQQPNFSTTIEKFPIIVYYKSHIRNNNTEEYYYENSTAVISCSADAGYPHPTQLTTRFMSFINNSAQMTSDAYYGKEAESSIQLVMNRSMNFQNLTCILQQPNFSNTTKTFPIIVYYKSSLKNNKTEEYYYENNAAVISCSADGGYPHPTQLTTQFMTFSNNTAQMTSDAYYGKEAESSIPIVMNRSMNFQNLTCILQQPNFPDTTKTFPIIVYYKSNIRNNIIKDYYYENNVAVVSCSAHAGYPHPKQLTIQFMSLSNNSTQMKDDAYYGKEAESSIHIYMKRSMNFQNLTCILQQPNFKETTKTFPIIVYYSAGSLIVSNTSPQLNEGDVFNMNCSSFDYGFPAPTIDFSIHKNDTIISYTRVKDKYRGERVIANLFAKVTKEWNNVEVTCTLMQYGFPSQSKSLTLILKSETCNSICVVIVIVSLLAVLVLVVIGVLLAKRRSQDKANDLSKRGNSTQMKMKINTNENNNSKPTVEQIYDKTTDLDDIKIIYQQVKVRNDPVHLHDRISLDSHCSYAEFTDIDSDVTKSTEMGNQECEENEYVNVTY